MAKKIGGKLVAVRYLSATNTKEPRLKVSSRYGSMVMKWDFDKSNFSGDQLKGRILGLKFVGSYGEDDIFTTSEKWNGEVKNG